MKFRSQFLLLLWLLLWIHAVKAQTLTSDSQIPLDPNIKIGKLENGITYYIRKNSKPENRLELRLAVNAGSILEDDDQLGLAHFTEHMAFNGTKNFSKNELVSYLQSVGVRFGAHLNAYTSFDETVYILHLPSDSSEIVNQGFQILEDWAHNLSFENEEIDKERGVVIEEWRLGQGAEMRMLDKYLPVIFKDSRYSKRLPIGTKEILENFEYETLKRFYRDWYRPELMAVIAVGDLEIEEMEAKIVQHFNNVPVSENPRERKTYPVPDHQETLVAIESDPEAAFTQVQLYFKSDPKPFITLADYRTLITQGIYTGLLNQRLEELRQKADPPFIFASIEYGSTWARTKSAYQAFAMVSENGVEKGLRTLLEETRRIRLHGFTQGELERYKKDMLILYQRAYNERDKTESGSYAGEYIANFLQKEPIPGIEFEYGYVQQILPGITLEDVNGLTEKWIKDDNRVVVITAPEKEGIVLPTKDQVRGILEEVANSQVEPYQDELAGLVLMEQVPTPGKIVKENELPEIGVTELTLSNGVQVKLKSTDFKNDEVLFYAYSPGGHSLYPDEDYYSATNSSSVVARSGVKEFSAIDLQKLMAGKIVSVTPFINELTEGLRGNSTPADMETMFQLIHLEFTAPRKDAEIFQGYITNNKALYKNLLSNPQYYYYDKLTRLLTQNHLRGGGFPKDEDWDKIDLERLHQIYQDRFKDASDFTFMFVGAFQMDQIKPLIETYLASLPTTNRTESWKDVGVRPPSGSVEKSFNKGTDPKSMVTLIFTGETEYDRNESYKLNAVAELLDIKLIETLREEKGGVYGASAGGQISQYPYSNYSVTIRFPCSPDNVDELIAATMAEIHKLKQNGPEEKDLNKVKETLKRERETNLKENSYWLTVLRSYYYNGEDPRETLKYEERINAITVQDIQETANKYLNTDNFIKVVLYPEEGE